ncbi:MAG: hypothetical protein JWQ87_2600 [Candidatus Sulfotelmatobacter sp.]|nr:hypothetical protein [Candidatus Sulfotelmatobacter sp.]
MLAICSGVVGSSVQVGYTLDRPEQSVQVDLHLAHVQEEAEIWWRFGGGSDRNRALLGNKGNSMHGMQIAQSRVNTGDCASR